jgi:hypothetical protein
MGATHAVGDERFDVMWEAPKTVPLLEQQITRRLDATRGD